MHKIVVPRKKLTFRDAPYFRVYIDGVTGFGKLGFRLETTVAHRFFSHFGCMSMESQRCLAEIIEFQLGRNRCFQLLLYTNSEVLEENAFLVTRKIVGHILVYTLGTPSKSETQ